MEGNEKEEVNMREMKEAIKLLVKQVWDCPSTTSSLILSSTLNLCSTAFSSLFCGILNGYWLHNMGRSGDDVGRPADDGSRGRLGNEHHEGGCRDGQGGAMRDTGLELLITAHSINTIMAHYQRCHAWFGRGG